MTEQGEEQKPRMRFKRNKLKAIPFLPLVPSWARHTLSWKDAWHSYAKWCNLGTMRVRWEEGLIGVSFRTEWRGCQISQSLCTSVTFPSWWGPSTVFPSSSGPQLLKYAKERVEPSWSYPVRVSLFYQTTLRPAAFTLLSRNSMIKRHMVSRVHFLPKWKMEVKGSSFT